MSRTVALKESAARRALHERHRPEKTLLYRIIDRHYPEFLAYIAEQGKPLPHHVEKEFAEYLKCGRLEHGFLRVKCSTCHSANCRSDSHTPVLSAVDSCYKTRICTSILLICYLD
ncbi:MAG: hypothetical protein ACI909_001512 [Planctomycetota bacterium]|jgi:hypothetical protein